MKKISQLQNTPAHTRDTVDNHYNNFVELKKLGVYMELEENFSEEQHFTRDKAKRNFRLPKELENTPVTLIPYPKMERGMHNAKNPSADKAILHYDLTFISKYRPVKQGKNSKVETEARMAAYLDLRDPEAYIILHKEPVTVQLVHVYNELLNKNDKYSLEVVKEGDSCLIHLRHLEMDVRKTIEKGLDDALKKTPAGLDPKLVARAGVKLKLDDEVFSDS